MDTQTRGFSGKQAAVYVGLSDQYLRMSRMEKNLGKMDAPPFCRIGSRVIYLRDDLDAWLDSRRQKVAA